MSEPPTSAVYGISRLTEHDVYLFREGTHFHLFDKLGAHCMSVNGQQGTLFAVWAPNAYRVSVIGDFNRWTHALHKLTPREDSSGIWEGFIPGIGHGDCYKYRIESHGHSVDKGDPYARYWQ